MIGLLRGRLLEKRPNQIILDVGGVGYLVAVPLSTYAAHAFTLVLLCCPHACREDGTHALRLSVRARKAFI
jgi:Holliday junction resolvasome RuvABC DNA-binding subunit